MISVISSHASTFVASGNSYLFHSLFHCCCTTKFAGEAVIRGGEPLHLTTSWKKCLLTSDAVYVGALKNVLSRLFYLRNLSRYAVRLPALGFLRMCPIVEHRKPAEDARASGSECSYTLDLTAVTNLCIS